MKSALTGWFPVATKPKRHGLYEGRRKDGTRFDVYWRVLQDTTEPSFYVWRGVLGPFNCWEDVTHTMRSWRGLATKPKDTK